MEKFNITETISESFQVLMEDFATFMTLGVISALSGLLISILIQFIPSGMIGIIIKGIIMLISVYFSIIFILTGINLSADALRGYELNLWDLFLESHEDLFKAFGYGLILFVITFLVVLISIIGPMFIIKTFNPLIVTGLIIITTVFIIFIFIRFTFFTHAIVLDESETFPLAYSWKATQGHMTRIIGAFGLLSAPIMIYGRIMRRVFSMGTSLPELFTVEWLFIILIPALVGVFIYPLSQILNTNIFLKISEYHDFMEDPFELNEESSELL